MDLAVTGILCDGPRAFGLPLDSRAPLSVAQGEHTTIRMRVVRASGEAIIEHTGATYELRMAQNWSSDVPRVFPGEVDANTREVVFTLNTEALRYLPAGRYGYAIVRTVSSRRDFLVPLSELALTAGL